MVHTVGFMGANGLVGTPTSQLLAQAAKEGKINLVIFHRSGSPPKAVPAQRNVELKVLNLDGPAAEIEKAVKGVNVFISAVGFGALPSEPNLVNALAKSPDFVTYIPSAYSTTYSEKDEADPQLGQVIAFIHGGWNRAKELGVGVTPVYIGSFESYLFETGTAFFYFPLPENFVWANKKQLQNRFPITTIDHLSRGLAGLATSDPQTIKNKAHSFVTFWPTGQEIADLYTKINGKPATIKDFTTEDREKINADAASFGPARVAYFDRWENDSWEYEKADKVYDTSYSGPSLEEVARRFA